MAKRQYFGLGLVSELGGNHGKLCELGETGPVGRVFMQGGPRLLVERYTQ